MEPFLLLLHIFLFILVYSSLLSCLELRQQERTTLTCEAEKWRVV